MIWLLAPDAAAWEHLTMLDGTVGVFATDTLVFELEGPSASDPAVLVAVEDVMARINASHPTVTLQVVPGDGEEPGVNEIYVDLFADRQFPLVSSFSASAGVGGEDGVAESCSVELIGALTSNVNKSRLHAYGGDTWTSLRGVLAHELGHCLGMGHEGGVYNVMGKGQTHLFTQGGWAYGYLGADAAEGVAALYGSDPDQRDVGVTHWERTGTTSANGDMYSVHNRTKLRSAQDPTSELEPYTNSDGEPTYELPAGASVYWTVQIENLGGTDEAFAVDCYLSTNDWISTSDTWLAGAGYQRVVGQSSPSDVLLTIPAATAPGRYHLGALVRSSLLMQYVPFEPDNDFTYVDVEVLEPGHYDFCSEAFPCAPAKGDCEDDTECADGSTCIHDVGAQYGYASDVDVCDYPLGDQRYCEAYAPCSAGEGDCDSGQCASGLVCSTDVGPDYGFASWVDVCEPPLGHLDYCRHFGTCGLNEGDCDGDAECVSGAVCLSDIGDRFGWSWLVDVCGVPIGDWNHCSYHGPCDAGEGDCDGDAECAQGLRCVDDVGPSHGFAVGIDVCE